MFKRKRKQSDFNAEVEAHLALEADRLKEQGLNDEDARATARRAFGNVTRAQERFYESNRWRWWDELLRDLRYGIRQLRRNPGFTIVAVLTLALGIGANTAIFTLINTVLLKSLPVASPEQLVLLGSTGRSGSTDFSFTYPVYRALRQQNTFLEDLAAFASVQLNVRVDGLVEPMVAGQLVSGSYFSVLGVTAVAGRTIGPQDDTAPGGNPVAMISYGYWTRRFDLSPSAIGKAIKIDGTLFNIIGVTPPDFFGIEVGDAPDVMVPLTMQPEVMPADESWLGRPVNVVNWLHLVGRLKADTAERGALAGLRIIYHRIMIEEAARQDAKFSEALRSERLVLAPGARGLSDLRRQYSVPLFILMMVVVLVLLIACANFSNLLLARAAARQREIAMRRALGAGRWRMTRQLLVESVLLASVGGAAGMMVAYWGCTALVRFMSIGRSAIFLKLTPDTTVFLFTAGISLATGLIFGIAPATWTSSLELTAGLKGSVGNPIEGSRRFPLGKVLVASQVALSIILLVGAGLLVRSLINLNSRNMGFDRQSVLLVRLEPKGSDQKRGANATRLNNLYQGLQDRVQSIPGVLSASLAGTTPTAPASPNRTIETPSGAEVRFANAQVYPKYFKTMGMAILSGRDFDRGDMGENAPRVAVISEALARAAFPNSNSVGNQFDCEGPNKPKCEIIGVVADERYSNLRGEPGAVVYQPFLQRNTGRGQMVLYVRSSGRLGGIREQVQAAVQATDPNLPAFRIQTLAAEIDAALAPERLVGILTGMFSLLALLLAAIGLYGVVAYTATRKTREIGIRMALGAERGEVLRMVIGRGLKLVLIGVVIGIAGALALTRSLSSLLYGVKPTDPLTFIAVSLALLAVALLACYIPARRAAKVDPMLALRHE